MPTGFVKSTIQASGSASSRTRADRHRSQCLPQSARAGGLLADAAAGKRDRLVGQPRFLPADAKLDQDERRALDRGIEVVGDGEFSVVPGRAEHPIGEPADDLAAFGVDVLQHELAEVEALPLARQPGHELRSVGRAAPDDSELHLVRDIDEVTVSCHNSGVKI